VDQVLAGHLLIGAVAEADGHYSDSEIEESLGWLWYKVGVGSSTENYLHQAHDITIQYLDSHGPDLYKKKITQNALAVFKSAAEEDKLAMLAFAREVADADWSFNDSVGNISDIELDLISYFCVQLGVNARDIPLTPPSPASGCFIATAAYGTPFAEEIDVLRSWRDEFLEASLPGRAFIKAYYSLSPPVANNISESEGKRKIVRTALGPIVKILKDNYSK